MQDGGRFHFVNLDQWQKLYTVNITLNADLAYYESCKLANYGLAEILDCARKDADAYGCGRVMRS
jgi:hypothetical protein